MGDGPGRGGGAAPPPPPARPGPGGRRRRCRRRLRAGGRAANGRGAPGGGGRGDAGRGRGAALGRRRSPRGGRRGGRRGRSSKPPPPTPRRRVGDAERRGTRPRLGLARLGCRGLRAARAPLPHWARKQKPRRHWAPGPAAPAPRFDKPGMERRRRRRRRGEGGKGRGPEGEPPADWPIPLPWLPLLPALIGGAVSPWWKGRLRARGSDEGRPRRGWVGEGEGGERCRGEPRPQTQSRPREGLAAAAAVGGARPSASRPRGPDVRPAAARSRSSGCPVPGATRRPSVAPALRDGQLVALPLCSALSEDAPGSALLPPRVPWSLCQYSADGLYGSSIRDVRSQRQRLQADGAEFCGGP